MARLVVIGGGLLGTIACMRLQEVHPDCSILCVRLGDTPVPRADTLRNQAWLQSGLRYARPEAVERAVSMWRAGARMFDGLGKKMPSRGLGFYRVSEKKARELRTLAAETDEYQSLVSVVEDETTLREALSGWFEAGEGVYLATPEAPFAEAELLDEARTLARGRGVALHEAAVACTLFQGDHGLEVDIDGERCAPGVVLLAAGAGNASLVCDLWPDHPFRLKQTPLAVVQEPLGMTAGVFVDSIREFSVVRHGSRYVVGLGELKRDIEPCAPEARQIQDVERATIRERLGAWLGRVPKHRLTAGVEPWVDDGKGRLDSDPYVEAVPFAPNVVVAFPGRATRAWVTVEDEVIPRIAPILAGAPAAEVHTRSPPWSGDISMHFAASYDDTLND